MLAAVAPAAPAAGAALVALTLLVTFLIALGLVLLVEQIVKAFFGIAGGVLAKVPVVGGWLNSSTHSVEQRIVATLGAAAMQLDGLVGLFWHTLGDLVRWTAHEIRASAGLLETIARLVANPLNIAAWKALWHQLYLRIKAGETALAHLAMRALSPLIHRVTALERWTYPRVKALEHEAGIAIPRDIAGLRARARTLEELYDSTWKLLKQLEARFSADVFAAAVAVALARLGMGWLRCTSVSRLGRRLACSGFGLLEDLLFGVIDVLVIADLCRITGVMVDLAESSVVQDALGGIIAGIDDLLLCQGVSRPDVLDGYWTDPPRLQSFAALPGV